MNKRFKITLLIIIGALLLSLVIWRLWPRSMEGIFSLDPNSASSITCTLMIDGLGSDGEPYTDFYNISNATADNEELHGIINLLCKSSYQQDFRNLLPWKITSAEADDSHDGRYVNISLQYADQYYRIFFFSKDMMVVSLGDDSGYRFYHPVNEDVFDNVVEYIQLNGEKSP